MFARVSVVDLKIYNDFVILLLIPRRWLKTVGAQNLICKHGRSSNRFLGE